MKRLFLALGMVLGIALGAFQSTPAKAAIAGCTPYGIGWPQAYIQLCTGATQNNSSGVVNALSNAPGQSTLTSWNGVKYSLITYMQALNKTNQLLGNFYVFKDAAAFEAWAPGVLGKAKISYPTAAQLLTVTGQTYVLNGGPQYTIVLLNITWPGGETANLTVNNTAGHETGHWMDALFASVAGQTSTNGVSYSAYFKTTLLNNDWASFNTLSACPQGGGGTFTFHGDQTGLQYGKSTVYICGGSQGAGPGLNAAAGYSGANKAVLQKAWPYIYTADTNGTWRELFAEVYGGGSLLDGQPDFENVPNVRDYYLGYQSDIAFQCERAFVNFIVQNAAMPTSKNKPSSWPSACPLS